jgi:peptidoglycan hydrolase CwlO-like protein
LRTTAALFLGLVLTTSAVWATGGARADSVQHKLDEARTDDDAAREALAKAEARMADLLARYQQLRVDLDNAAREAVAVQVEHDDLTVDLADAQEQLAQRVTTAYELGPAAAIDLFLGAQSTADFASIQVFVGSTFQVDDSTVSQVAAIRQSLSDLAVMSEERQQGLAGSIARVLQLTEEAETDLAEAERAAKATGLQVKRLEKKERELERARAAAAASLSDYLGSGGIGAGCASGMVHDLIVDAFTPLGQDQVQTALAVATRESNCRPNAYNSQEVPPYGNASGVFQILYPGIWKPWSERCGRKGADVFDPEANVAVAACVVADQGWWPWGF